MTVEDEKLMAYADGQLDAAERAEVEAAMASDPEVAQRVEQHRALRRKINAAFDPVLLETVPDELVAATRAAPARPELASTAASSATTSKTARREATVTDLRRVRAARKAEAASVASIARKPETPHRPWTWVEWGSMAASVAAGGVITFLAMTSPGTERVGLRNGALVARADLEQALSNQLASDPPPGSYVQIGLSFRNKTGDYCRTFMLKEASPRAGLACRQSNRWNIQVLAQAPATATAEGGYKLAGSEIPPAVMTAAQAAIAGEPFDADAEKAARSKGWEP
jgi:putative zinc finger protein